MKKTEIIKSAMVFITFVLFILTKTPLLAGSKLANVIISILIASTLLYVFITAIKNIKKSNPS